MISILRGHASIKSEWSAAGMDILADDGRLQLRAAFLPSAPHCTPPEVLRPGVQPGARQEPQAADGHGHLWWWEGRLEVVGVWVGWGRGWGEGGKQV